MFLVFLQKLLVCFYYHHIHEAFYEVSIPLDSIYLADIWAS